MFSLKDVGVASLSPAAAVMLLTPTKVDYALY
jgi:hypothetical protein